MAAALKLLYFPIVGGVIGWLTNFIAIKMLFRPRRPILFLGIRFQGLIPKRKADLAHRLAEAVTRDLVSSRDIADLLSQMDWEREIKDLLEKVIEEDLQKSSINKFPFVGIIADNLLFHIRSVMTTEISRRLDRHRDKILERVHSQMDLKALILEKINSFDLEYLEILTKDLVRRELRAIEVLGGALGVFIGSLHLVLEIFQ